MKHETRKLERQYRRLRTQAAETAWREQFRRQRRLYEDKFTSYWCETVDKYRNNARGLWRTVRQLLNTPQQSSTTKLSANDFTDFFCDKIATIRQSIATATLPIIVPRRSVPALQVFDPVTVSEIQSLLATSPATYCPLDPIPTWLLKELAPYMVPVCLLYTSPSPRDRQKSRMPSSA